MSILDQLNRALIVSCQAEEGFPLNKPEHLAAMAASTVIGGARGIRANGPENIRAIRQVVKVPIIGIYKQNYPDFDVRITPTLTEVEQIVAAGADILALDATKRPRPDDLSLETLFSAIKERSALPIMADISTFEEGVHAVQLGADLIATTLSGYTSYSPQLRGPDFQLIRALSQAVDIPVIAEGRIRSPEDARTAIEIGAYAVVVGSMITRPHIITAHFNASISELDT